MSQNIRDEEEITRKNIKVRHLISGPAESTSLLSDTDNILPQSQQKKPRDAHEISPIKNAEDISKKAFKMMSGFLIILGSTLIALGIIFAFLTFGIGIAVSVLGGLVVLGGICTRIVGRYSHSSTLEIKPLNEENAPSNNEGIVKEVYEPYSNSALSPAQISSLSESSNPSDDASNSEGPDEFCDVDATPPIKPSNNDEDHSDNSRRLPSNELWAILCGIANNLNNESKGRVEFYQLKNNEYVPSQGNECTMFVYTDGDGKRLCVFSPITNKTSKNCDEQSLSFFKDIFGQQIVLPSNLSASERATTCIFPVAEAAYRGHWVFVKGTLVDNNELDEVKCYDPKSRFGHDLFRFFPGASTRDEGYIAKTFGVEKMEIEYLAKQSQFNSSDCGWHVASAIEALLEGREPCAYQLNKEHLIKCENLVN